MAGDEEGAHRAKPEPGDDLLASGCRTGDAVRTAPTRRSMILRAGSTALGASACTVPIASGSVESYIRERSRQWTDAYVTGQVQVMETILAPDFVGTSPRGLRSGKAAAIAAAKQGPASFRSAQVGPIEVRVFGDAAIALGGDILVLRQGSPQPIMTAWTDVWLLREGRWLVAASHESELEPAA